ncbi:MAG: AAA family ATPase [Desulfurococcales archaeon]|nr:AAA family ATPase [Desulfurococcales archaeon]
MRKTKARHGVSKRRKTRPLYMISKIKIKNFKNIKETNITLLPGVNILVGPNASGKTSILEAMYFLYKALIDAAEKTPYRPHVPEYWSGLDLIHDKDPSKNIEIGITLNVYFSSNSEDDKWCHETIEGSVVFGYDTQRDTVLPIEYNFLISNYLSLKININFVEIMINKEFWEASGKPGLNSASSIIEKSNKVILTYNIEQKRTTSVFLHPGVITSVYESDFRVVDHSIKKKDDNKSSYIVSLLRFPLLDVKIPVVLKPFTGCLEEAKGIPVSRDNMLLNFLLGRVDYLDPSLAILLLFDAIRKIVFLRHPDAGALREPRPFTGSNRLNPRAQNLAEVLLTLHGRLGRMPERLEELISKAFPEFRVWVDSKFGRVVLMSEWRGIEMPPPNLPDGLIKTLAIGAAIELGPSLLLIDEIENSLHASLLEIIIDELNQLPVPVIAATHSPIPVDIVGPERTIVVLPERDGAVVERIKDPARLRKSLAEHGITFSDYIYGVTGKD